LARLSTAVESGASCMPSFRAAAEGIFDGGAIHDDCSSTSHASLRPSRRGESTPMLQAAAQSNTCAACASKSPWRTACVQRGLSRSPPARVASRARPRAKGAQPPALAQSVRPREPARGVLPGRGALLRHLERCLLGSAVKLPEAKSKRRAGGTRIGARSRYGC
jgi:hypothetical protein